MHRSAKEQQSFFPLKEMKGKRLEIFAAESGFFGTLAFKNV
jgi:hypothetical protein